MSNFLSLALQDPLEKHEVVVTIRVKPNSGAKRQDRKVLVSLGIEGQFPLITEGELGDIEEIISEQWIAAAKQLNLDEVSEAPAETGTESSNTVSSDDPEGVVGEALIDEEDLF